MKPLLNLQNENKADHSHRDISGGTSAGQV